MKTVLALTIGFLALVFCNCGSSSVGNVNKNPQFEMADRMPSPSFEAVDTLIKSK